MILLQSIIYGFGNPLTKIAYQSITPFWGLTFRFGLALCILLILCGKRTVTQLKKVRLNVYLPASVCMAVAYITCNLALQLTTATNVGFAMSLPVIFAPILSVIVLKKKFRLSVIPVQLMVVVGLYLMCLNEGSLRVGRGEILALATAVSVAGALVFGEKAMLELDAVAISTTQIGTTFLFSLLGALCFENEVSIGMVRPEAWGVIIYLATACTCAAYILQNSAVKHLSAATVSILQCTAPIATAAASYVILGERLSSAGIAGAVIIIACILFENYMENRYL